MIRSVSFDHFRDAIGALPALPAKATYTKDDILRDDFLLFRDAGLDAYYAPFHRLNHRARVVLVGLTPGWTQTELAYRTARQALAEGVPDDQLFELVDLAACFGGPMRTNLVMMLDGIGLSECLGVPSCIALFHESSHLAHFTSTVSAPIFRLRENYTGNRPALLRVPKLHTFMADNLVAGTQRLARRDHCSSGQSRKRCDPSNARRTRHQPRPIRGESAASIRCQRSSSGALPPTTSTMASTTETLVCRTAHGLGPVAFLLPC